MIALDLKPDLFYSAVTIRSILELEETWEAAPVFWINWHGGIYLS